MKPVLVDRCIWYEVLRKNNSDDYDEIIQDLVRLSLIRMIGPIRQELLSGIKTHKQFAILRRSS